MDGRHALGKIEGADLVWTGQVGAGRSFAAGRESSPGAQLTQLAQLAPFSIQKILFCRSSTPILQFNDVLRTFCFNLRNERMGEFLQRE